MAGGVYRKDHSNYVTPTGPVASFFDFLASILRPKNQPTEWTGAKDIPQQTAQPVQTPQPSQIPQVLAAATPAPNNELSGFNTARGLPPEKIKKIILDVSKTHSVDPALVAAILFNESGFNENIPDNINYNKETGQIDSRDRGISQINDKWHPEITNDQARDPNFAINFLAKKLTGDINYFGNLEKGTTAYNVGRRGVVSNPQDAEIYRRRIYANLTPDKAFQLGIATPSANLQR